MQSNEAIVPNRYLLLSPAGMATAFAVLAFLKGLFAWPLLALVHAHMVGWMGGVERSETGPIQINPGGGGLPAQPGGPPSGPMPAPGADMWKMHGGPHDYGYMAAHHFGGFWLSPFTYVLIWLATIVVAAVAGALLALIYNWVAERTGRAARATATT